MLGPIEVDGVDGPVQMGGPIPRTVFGVLVAMAGTPVSTDRLIMEVYGPDAGDSRRGRIEDTVSTLRKALGGDRERIGFGPGGYQLDIPPESVDAARFDQLVEDARRLAGSAPKEALASVEAALSLWRGDPFSGTRDSELLESERRRLREVHGAATVEHCALQFALGDLDAVVSRLAQLCGDAQLSERERLWTLRMQALYAAGRQQDALEVAREAERRLAVDHGLPLSPAFRELEARILAHDPGLIPPPERVDACPYKGLEAYQPQDAHLFHGRQMALDDVLAAVASSRLTVVTGRSGVGKSSIVRAGLVPALQRGRLSTPYVDTVLTPGPDPAGGAAALEAAAAALGGRPALVVLDQAEELFTLSWPSGDAERYLDRLADLALSHEPLVRVVVVVRDDLLGRLVEHQRFSPGRRAATAAVETVVIRPMSRAELRDAIRLPAVDVGLTVDDALVERLLDDASGPGTLPLLSHALLQTWRRADRRRGVLTAADYELTGGLHAAVGRTADELHAAMGPSSQTLMRRIFLELVEFGGPSLPDSRRPAALDVLLRLGDPDEVLEVVEELVAARLLSVGAGGFELVHEALLVSWPKLVDWIDTEREHIAFERHLTADALNWERTGRDPDVLYRGARLDRAREVLDARPTPAADDPVAAFVAAGSAQQVLARRERRLRRVSLAVSVLLLAGLAGAAGQRLWIARAESHARQQASALSPLVRFDGPAGAFELEQYEVRIEQYRRCVERNRCSPIDGSSTVSLLDAAPPDLPVSFVSYRQAQTYCRWIGRRLPTQDELEWAITRGGTRRYPWGDRDPLSFAADQAPLLLEMVLDRLGDDVPGLPLLPVTAGTRSQEGLANLVGNVAEWTSTERSEVEVVVTGLGASDGVESATAGDFSFGRVLEGDDDVGMRCASDAS